MFLSLKNLKGASNLSTRSYTPRLNISIREDQHLALQQKIEWGTKTAIFQALIDVFLRAVDKHGQIAVVYLVEGKLTIEDLVKLGEDNARTSNK